MITSSLVFYTAFEQNKIANATTVAANFQFNPLPVDTSIAGSYGINITSISCPYSTLCLGVDSSGRILEDTNPESATTKWTFSSLDSSTSLNYISCPINSITSSAICITVGQNGDVYTTSNVSGSSPIVWSKSSVDSSNAIVSLSCPSVSLCVAGDSNGNIITSTSPTTTGSWLVSNVDSGEIILALTCFSSNLCIAGDSNGNILDSISPASASSWTSNKVDGYFKLSTAFCLNVNLCLMADNMGRVLTSFTPTVSSSWTINIVDSGTSINSVACPSPTFCVAVDSAGNILNSNDPTVLQSWSTFDADSTNSIIDISCPSINLCIAVDDAGNILYSTNPMSVSSWQIVNVDGNNSFVSVSCSSVAFCGATDSSGNIAYSTSPASGTWQVYDAEAYLSPITPYAISCPNLESCYIVGSSGMLLYSASVSSGPQSFQEANIDSSFDITGISCYSTDLCFATDDNGDILYANLSKSSSWTTYNLSGINSIVSLNCASDAQCVVTLSNGQIALSNSVMQSTSWTFMNPDESMPIGSSQCISTTFCIVGDTGGQLWLGINSITSGDQFMPVPLTRVCDTRLNTNPNQCNGFGTNSETLTPNSNLNVSLVSQVKSDLPVGVNPDAAVVNVTVTNTSSNGGFLTVSPGGSNLLSDSSVLNWSAGQTTANLTVVQLGPLDDINLYNSVGSADVIVDLIGFFVTPGINSGYYVSVNPDRICDTRVGVNIIPNQCNDNGTKHNILPAGSSLTIQVSGNDSIPSNAIAVAINLTATNTQQNGGYLIADATGNGTPNISNLNYDNNESVSNEAIVPLSATGSITIYNFIGTTDVIVDVSGYFTSTLTSTIPGVDLSFVPAVPTRVCDTRVGINTIPNPCNQFGKTDSYLTSNSNMVVPISGRGEIPSSNVFAVWSNLTATNTTSNGGYISASPTAPSSPFEFSNLNWDQGQTVGHSALVQLSNVGDITISNYIGNVDIIVDINGWFV